MFNSCPTRIQDTLYRFQSYQAAIGYLQTIQVSHFVDSFVTVGQNTLAKTPVYSLGLVAAHTHYVAVVKVDVLLYGQPKSVIIQLPVSCISIQKRIRILSKSG